MAKHRIGQDPADLARQRSARASQTAGEGVEEQIAAYRERSKAGRQRIPTPGAPPPAPEPVAEAATEAPKAPPKSSSKDASKDERRSRK